ncbi:MAG: RNA polymerase factor sigma-54 [Bacteroidota bacterium]
MQKLRLGQTLSQKLSPQKLQLIKLLQVPSVALQSRIEQELASNPALEEAVDAPEASSDAEELPQEEAWQERSDSYTSYNTRNNQRQDPSDAREPILSVPDTLGEQLLKQLDLLRLDQHQHTIGQYLIGSIDEDGYIRQDLEVIVNELAFTQYLETNVQEVAAVLAKVQRFDPPGVGARSLQECLLIQLKKRPGPNTTSELAQQILTRCFEEFTKKHYEKITEKLQVKDSQLLKDALALIARLNPKPGGNLNAASRSEVLYPDFVVTKQNSQLQVSLSNYRVPPLRTRKSYVSMLENYQKHKKQDKRLKEATSFAKKQLEAAQWFIDAVRQRQYTLLNTMEAIVRLQHDFFMEEDDQRLEPMILKHVAEEIGMDISTVSRIVNNKSVQTDWGVYRLKHFFTEAITTESGEEISNRAVKKAIEELIRQENKQQPYTDDKIVALLKEKGYPLARRTVAKYREQLQLPVARLRKEL